MNAQEQVDSAKKSGRARQEMAKDEYLTISFRNLNFTGRAPNNQCPIVEHALQKFFPEGNIADDINPPSQPQLQLPSSLSPDDNQALKAWDQFLDNEVRFNVRAEYDETKYTTAINKELLTNKQIETADSIAQAILAQHVQSSALPGARKHSPDSDEDGGAEGAGTVEKAKEEAQRKKLPAAKAPRQLAAQHSTRTGYHRNSFDELGIDPGRSMDPETHRLLLKLKHERKTMLAVQHIKSLVSEQ